MILAVNAQNLSKTFGRIKAVNNVSFKVLKGQIFGLIGPNGAGKTTILRIVATLLKPTSGSVEVFGMDVVDEADKVRSIISYLPEEAGAYRNLTGMEYLKFMAGIYAKTKVDAKSFVKEAIEISGLGDRLNDRVKTYSKGMVRRLLLARALMFKPKLAILDEPTSGLDVIHAHHVRRAIKDCVKRYGVTVLISSHNMLEVEFLCDRIALIDKGRIIEEGRPKELKSKYNSANLEEVFVKVTNSVEKA